MTNVTTRWRADETAGGKLRHEYTAATLQFQTNALTGGEVIFNMTSAPDKWASAPEARPASAMELLKR